MTGWYQNKPYRVIAQCSNLLFVRCLWGRIKEYLWIVSEDLNNVDYEQELQALEFDSSYLLNHEAVMIREAEKRFEPSSYSYWGR